MFFNMKFASLFLLWLGSLTQADPLPPGSLNITVPPIPDNLLGQNITLFDPSAAPFASGSNKNTSLAPGIPADYHGTTATRLGRRTTGPFRPGDTTYPYRCIGKAYVGRVTSSGTYIVDYIMTGTIVGTNVLLLEANFLTDAWSGNPWFIHFVPVYASGAAPYGDTYVQTCHGTRAGGGVSGVDYIVCRMYNPLGSTTGYLGSLSYGDPTQYFNTQYYLGGYPNALNGELLGVWSGVPVISYDPPANSGILLETLPFSPVDGVIGGPLWNLATLQVVGVLSGNNADAGESVRSNFAGGINLVNYINYGRTTWV